MSSTWTLVLHACVRDLRFSKGSKRQQFLLQTKEYRPTTHAHQSDAWTHQTLMRQAGGGGEDLIHNFICLYGVLILGAKHHQRMRGGRQAWIRRIGSN
ncbi:hypothetical protein Mapa_010201 [Marchantia paleacea]|nr:hypothetical protein Mapa_010201 [Marchantia paleacea]